MPVPKIHYRDPDAPSQLAAALHDTGFAALTQSPIPVTLITEASHLLPLRCR